MCIARMCIARMIAELSLSLRDDVSSHSHLVDADSRGVGGQKRAVAIVEEVGHALKAHLKVVHGDDERGLLVAPLENVRLDLGVSAVHLVRLVCV